MKQARVCGIESFDRGLGPGKERDQYLPSLSHAGTRGI